MLGSLSTSSLLSDKYKYPSFARIAPPDDYQAKAIIDILKYLKKESGQAQYLEVAVIVTSNSYGVNGAKQLINSGQLDIKTYQQFLSGTDDVSVEVFEMDKSKARVFILIIDNNADTQLLLSTANEKEYQIIGPSYIWVCYDGCANDFTTRDAATYEVIEKYVLLAQGIIGVSLSKSRGKIYNQVNEEWMEVDPVEFPSVAGANSSMSIDVQYAYDSVLFISSALNNLILADGFDENGRIRSTEQFYQIIVNTTVEGVTGKLMLDVLGNREPIYDIVNLRSGNASFSIIGSWNTENGLVFEKEIEFHGGSTKVPDIDIRPPFNYWSCPDGEKKSDLTGKTIHVHSPDGDNPPNIDITYHCDHFIDCGNLSDETADCSSNYTILFIVYGVITGLFILIAILFLIITIFFGFIVKRRRITAASPFFLVIVCLSCILGFASTYSWYGKPQKVACGFQPWLLGIAIISLVSSLFSKTFRIWRIFKSPLKKNIITNVELFIMWVVMMIPAVFILFLWTLISTPAADMKEVDGEKHYVCVTGGFTGPPGGFVFFFIFVGYTGLVLCFGIFLSIVTRDVPSLFNESKLIAISIYNLVFLSVVIIPVVIVLNDLNPFASWIIRTTGILYAFFTTLFLQFLPKLVYIILVERGKEIDLNRNLLDFEMNTAATGSNTFNTNYNSNYDSIQS